jgi:hypothetical protein
MAKYDQPWVYLGKSLGDNQMSFEISGVNVWQYTWQHRGNVPVHDPNTNRNYSCPSYEIVIGEKQIIFAADEVANGYWLFFISPVHR